MKNKHRENRPFGSDGPRVVPLATELTPRPDSELTSFGLRILRGIPPNGIGLRGLAEKLNLLGDYAGFTDAIDTLRRKGYIKTDENSYITFLSKGKKELSRR